MKLPRWLVISMLTSSVLAVLAAAGLWWVTWPERTARKFVELLAAGQTEEAEKMMAKSTADYGMVRMVLLPESWEDIKPQPRSLVDLLRCKRSYRMTKGYVGTGVNLTVERGTVTEPAHPFLWAGSIHTD